MKLVSLASLVGKPIEGMRADIRSRNADGSLIYPEQQKSPIMVELKKVAIEQRGYCCGSKSEKHPGKFPWLYWYWDGYSCNYAGHRIDNGEMPSIYIEAEIESEVA